MEKEKRNFQIEIGEVRAETRTVAATLSSTYPVKRFDGHEILLHEPGAVDLSREPLPLLCAHNDRTLPVGVVEGLKVEGQKLRGNLRFSQSQDAILKDVQDGIIRNISIGYVVKNRSKTKDGYLVTKWMPFECSLVSVPADPTVGIGRNFKSEKGKRTMDKNDILKSKKVAVEELAELAKTGENAERMEELKGEIRTLDSRLEAFDLVEKNKIKPEPFVPEIDKKDRQLITFEGGPAYDRTFAGMFNQRRKLEIDTEEIKRFRASMVEGVPSSGGFSVPEPLAAKWLDDSLPNEIVRPRATVWPMTSASRKVPGWDGADQSAGKYFGGFEMEFLAEEGEGSKQTGKLRLIELNAKKGAIFCDCSSELIEDGLGFERQLELAIKKSLSLGMDYYLLNGVGGASPLGVVNSPGVVTVAKEVGQQADTLMFENISKMYARMYPGGRSKAIYIANETCLPPLMTGMTVSVGTGGSFVNIFSENNGNFTLLGRPLILTPNLPVLGDAGDIIFVDLSQYAIGIRREIRLEKSNIPGWIADLFSYRVLVRFDGQGQWSGVLKPRNGDDLGWCVKLAERAL
ncbi:MAG: phage major capsid protein [Desulfobacterales bacterium]